MINKKSLFVILSFCIMCLGIIYYALNLKKRALGQSAHIDAKSEVTSLFKNSHFYRSFEHKPNLILESETLLIRNNRYISFQAPKGIFFNNEKRYNYTALKGNLDQASNNLDLYGEVLLTSVDGDYASDEIHYLGGEDIISAKGHVSSQMVDKKTLDLIKVKSESMKSYVKESRVELYGNVRGNIKRKKIYEGGIKFSSETVIFNSLNSQLDLSENVKIRRNNYYLRSGNAQIFLQNYNKKLKYYVLHDDVKLEEKLTLVSGKVQMRKAFAEKAEGIESTGQIILTGAPRVEQGNDVIKGYQITLRENSELVEVDDAQSNFRMKKE